MGFRDDIPKLTEEEFANLPALVRRGEDRAATLKKVVDGWCTATGKEKLDEHLAAGGFMLDRVALVDENTGEPIDLGDLLRMVEERLVPGGPSADFKERRDLFILLRACRVDRCHASKTKVRPRFVAAGCSFGDAARFDSATFGDWAYFGSATFGEWARFASATFGDGASFDSATFGDRARFDSATFGHGASFDSATFADSAGFASATFGDQARFDSAKFGDWASFDSATFGHLTRFNSATFADGASFDSATFGDWARFASATFGVWARFASATFGVWASFDSATFGGTASFASTTFGARASFANTRMSGPVDLLNARFGPAGGVRGAVVRTRPLPKGFWQSQLAEPVRRQRERFSWNTVAALGRLQVLTRVSYVALLLVPLVAGAWPALRDLTSWASQATQDAASALHRTHEEVKTLTQRLPSGDWQPATQKVEAAAAKLDQHAQALATKVQDLGEKAQHLPRGWVLAFLAALCVAVGHLVYQLAAHETVRQFSPDAFRQQWRDTFGKAAEHQRRDLLGRAFPPLHKVAEVLPGSRHPSLVRRNNEAVWIPKDLEQLERVAASRAEEDSKGTSGASTSGATEGDVIPPPTGGAEAGAPRGASARAVAGERTAVPFTRSELEQVVIDEGALAEYDLLARRRMGWAYVSGLMYLAGAVFVTWLVYVQLQVVLTAAGWWPASW